MKTFCIIVAVCLCATSALAQVAFNNGPNYQGSSGTHYQYDLSNPSDQLRYSTDLSAQRNDSLSVNPGVSLDRGLGQNGGGISD